MDSGRERDDVVCESHRRLVTEHKKTLSIEKYKNMVDRQLLVQDHGRSKIIVQQLLLIDHVFVLVVRYLSTTKFLMGESVSESTVL